MLFAKIVRKIPYVGNLVKTSYLVKNSVNPTFSSTIFSNSFRLFDKRVLFGSTFTGLVVSDYEVYEAHMRYIKYIDKIPNELTKTPIGKFTENFKIETRRVGRQTVSMNIIHVMQDNDRIGLMFSDSDLKSITERTKRAYNSVRRPKWYQYPILWINCLK